MSFVEIKTSELIDLALDWAVAKCEGFKLHAAASLVIMESYNPSTDWSQGGPIIEREVSKVFRNVGDTWSAMILKDIPLTTDERGTSLALSRREQWNGAGPTPLIAAMRCYVASELGDVVEIPLELAP